MKKPYLFINMTLLSLALFACGDSKESFDKLITGAIMPEESTIVATSKADTPAFKTLEWTDLMPAEDLQALLNPPEYLDEVEDGSADDQISNQLKINTSKADPDDLYQQALVSKKVKTEMDGEKIRLAGFIVPLDFNDQQKLTEFFLVPYFGACIHVPPPPPNQIIYISYPQGIERPGLPDPFWVSGVLKTTLVENEMATSAYSMEVEQVERYREEWLY